MQTDNSDVIRLAHGRWPNILLHFGATEKQVSMKHAPCPMCEGKDRFRLIDSTNGGRWICNQCGSGDGMDLLMNILHCDFKSAAEKLRPLVYDFPMSPPTRGPTGDEKKRYLMKNVEMWKGAAADHETLGEYLESRGLRAAEYVGADLRLANEMPFYDDEGNFKKNMPCMLARISSRDGKLAAIHRTYLHKSKDGEFSTSKKITKPSREWSGGAVRLFSTKDENRLIVGEGIESVLSVRAHIYRLHGVLLPCWAGVSANNLEKIAIPEHITNIMVAADNDLSFTGQKSAYILANRLTVHDKRKCNVQVPATDGYDFNDTLINTKYEATI
jgi:putative DNA primase/helicase